MTVSTLGTYVPTADEFISHAADVNANRAANGLPEVEMEGGYKMGDFSTDRDALDAKMTSLVALENLLEEATDDRDAQKKNMRERAKQFRSRMRSRLKSSKYFKRIPRLARMDLSESKFLRPFDDLADTWARIDADATIPVFTPPLLLRGGYTLAGFVADLATMRTLYKGVTDAENDEGIALKERDALLGPLKERMHQYRAEILAEYGEDHPFTLSLPEVTPHAGSTPGDFEAEIVWSVSLEQAGITWTASTDPNLDHYEIRKSDGATYDAATATVIGNVPATTQEFFTTEGLENPGDTASYKVFVILTTGNEAGSNAVTLTRP